MALMKRDESAGQRKGRNNPGLVINLFGPGEVWLQGQRLDLDKREAKWVLFSLALEAVLKCEGGTVKRQDLEGRFWYGDSKQNGLDQSLFVLRSKLGREKVRLNTLKARQLSFDLNGVEVDIHNFVQALERGDKNSLEDAHTLLQRGLLQGHMLPWLTRYREVCWSMYHEACGNAEVHDDLPAHLPCIRPVSLPELTITLVGRDSDADHVTALFKKPMRLATAAENGHAEAVTLLLNEPGRVVTLTGFPGVGKTSLAKQVGKQLLPAPDYRDGVWFVDLSDVTHSSHIPMAVARVLKVPEESDPATALQTYLKQKRALLILDNCEHVIQTCSQFVESLLAHCIYVRILTTSREPLRLACETRYHVRPLQVPEPDAQYTLDEFRSVGAVQLFIERATAVWDGFQIDEGNMSTLGQICRQMDGLPLALELAAALVEDVTLKELAAGWQANFDRLIKLDIAQPAHHRSLWAMLDWSYARLTEQERVLLCRVAAFSGGWDLEAAETVCADELVKVHDIRLVLVRLRQKSLVQIEEQNHKKRYRLFETVKRYGMEKLQALSEAETARERHANYFLALAEELAPLLNGSQQQTCLDRLAAEHHNLHTALELCREAVSELSWRMGVALSRYWEIKGYHNEGLSYLKALLQHKGGVAPLLRAQTLYAAGRLARYRSEFDTAFDLVEESKELFRLHGNIADAAHALLLSGMIQTYRGNIDDGLLRYQESRDLFLQSGDNIGLANALDLLGYVALGKKDYDGALNLFEESLFICRKLKDKNRIAHVLIGLASAVWKHGNRAYTSVLLQESKKIFEEIDSKMGIAATLMTMAKHSYGPDAIREAYRLFEQSLEMYENAGDDYHCVHLLICLAQLDCTVGDYDAARSRISGAIQRYDDGSGHQSRRFWFAQGKLALHLCDFEQAHVLTEQTLQKFIKGPRNPFYPMVLIQLGIIVFHLGDDRQAEESFVTALEYCHNVANAEDTVNARNGLGMLACRQGSYQAACTHFSASLDALHKLDDWMRTAVCLEGLAEAMQGLRTPERAATLLGAATALREAVGAPLPPCDQPRYDRVLAAVRSRLSAEQFASARAEGSQLTLPGAIGYAFRLLS